MKRTRLATLVCFTAMSLPAFSQSLEQAIAATLVSNPEIRESYNQYKSYVEQRSSSGGDYLPTVDLDAGVGYEKVNPAVGERTELNRKDATLTLTQLIWDGSSTLNDMDRTEAEAESMRFQLIADAQDKALEVASIYLDAVKAQEVLLLSEGNLKTHKRIYNDIKRRVESGIGSTADLSQVESRLANASSNLLAAQNNIFDTHTQFTRIVGESPSNLVFPRADQDTIPLTLDEAVLLAEKHHPVVKISSFDVDAANYQYKQAKGTNLPTFSFEASQAWYEDADGTEGNRDEFSAMVRMRYNLYNGGSDSADQNRMAYQLNVAKDLRDKAHRQLAESLRLAWSALDLTLQQKQFLSDRVDSSSDTAIAYEKQYRIGQRTLLDVLNTEDELFQARRAYLDANYDEQYAKYRVLNACGTLLDSLLVDIPDEWKEKADY